METNRHDDNPQTGQAVRYYAEVSKGSTWPSTLWEWIQLGGVGFAFIAAILGAGIAFGPISTTPEAIRKLEERFSNVELKLTTVQWHLDEQRRQSVTFDERLNVSVSDRQELWKVLRKVESDTAGFLSRIEFVEWKGTFEARNPRTSVPSLKEKPW